MRRLPITNPRDLNMKKLLLLFLLLTASSATFAQRVMWMKPKNPIVCYGKQQTGTSHVPMSPDVLAKLAAGRSQAIKTSNFIVDYEGFSPAAEEAFQKAVDIWESIIVSPVDIHVHAVWTPLGSGVLGSATAGTFYANFNGAQQLNTWYPVALAEKMAGGDLNEPGEEDIFAQFNSSNNNWYYGLDGATPANQYDLVTVVLHELGHGLGFLDSYGVEGTVGTVGLSGTGRPVIYDLSLETGSGENLYINSEHNTEDLRALLTSNNLFFGSPSAKAANGGTSAKVYAPTTFSSGSSIAHLDESTFAGGTANALMTPQIGSGESNFDPGAIVKGAFADMGWVFTYITHEPLKNQEDSTSNRIVTAVITTDSGSIASPTLVYNTGSNDTEIAMTATANPNEYQAEIPMTGVATVYSYYLRVEDSSDRLISRPGKRTTPETGVEQVYFTFETGEDRRAPIVNHTAPGFVLPVDTALLLQAYIIDNIGIASAQVEYSIDGGSTQTIDLELQEPGRDSVYYALIDLGEGLPIGSFIQYRILVTDNSSNENQLILPADGVFEVTVEGLGEPVDVYMNNFNTTSSDFFGNGFSIETVAGFSNGAIHSEHPYINGDGFPGGERNLVYQLKVPVRVKDSDAFMTFDEVVLVEPGQAGTVFGDANFFDYVVVEGSTDGGENWIPLADGYDSRDRNDWLTRFESSVDGNGNSTAVGDENLYRTRQISLLDEFDAGDEVAIRFRLFIDPFSSGWGWAIDNLKIQTDIVRPQVLHNHVDFVEAGSAIPDLRVLARDAGGIESLAIHYFKNSDTEQSTQATDSLDFTFQLPTGVLASGDKVSYAFTAADPTGNETRIPTTGYFTIQAVAFSAAVDSYTNSFEAGAADFVGNFFAVSKPSGFSSNIFKTANPYLNGFGVDSTSHYTATLTKPIRVGSGNTLMKFDEIAIVQNQASGILFGTEAFNDYVIVEASADGGETWQALLDGYDATLQTVWSSQFNNGGSGSQTQFRSRLIDLTESGDFETNDEILIRFRLFADFTSNGWGWAIDNLSIQGAVTGLESLMTQSLAAYPNPARETLFVEARVNDNKGVAIELRSTQGTALYTEEVQPVGGRISREIPLGNLPDGLYLLRVSDGTSFTVKKIVKQ